jgi:urease beta subunit
VSCVRLAEILETVGHDSVNRFLLREEYNAKDLFDEIKGELVLAGGTLSVDDSVIDKPYSAPSKAELIDYFWSGKHQRTVKGINLITLYYTDILGHSYREGKTKNDYFLEMVDEVKRWGVKPAWVTGDSWYASLLNLKFLRKAAVGFCFGIAVNRTVSLEKGSEVQVQTLSVTASGLMMLVAN